SPKAPPLLLEAKSVPRARDLPALTQGPLYKPGFPQAPATPSPRTPLRITQGWASSAVRTLRPAISSGDDPYCCKFAASALVTDAVGELDRTSKICRAKESGIERRQIYLSAKFWRV